MIGRRKIYVNGKIHMCFDVDNLTENHLLARQEGKCFYCGCEIKKFGTKKGAHKKIYTSDHFFPKSKGNRLKNNKVLACRECNEQKDSRDPTKAEIKKFLRIYNGFAYSGGIKL